MLELNTYVMYGLNGVCLVKDKKRQKFGGVIRDYYILKPVNSDASTYYIPVDNDELLGKMRKLLTYDEIMEIIHSLPDDSIKWVDDNKEREEYYKEIFERGDRHELLLLIKTIYAHKTLRKEEGKKLWTIDENAMKHAEKLVYEEFATVLHIAPDKVVDFITEELDKDNPNAAQEPGARQAVPAEQ